MMGPEVLSPDFAGNAAFVELNCGRNHAVVERPTRDRVDVEAWAVDHTFVKRDGVFVCVRHPKRI